jgi:hypothetical protein
VKGAHGLTASAKAMPRRKVAAMSSPHGGRGASHSYRAAWTNPAWEPPVGAGAG